MTKEIKSVAAALSIVEHDHVIIGSGEHLNFRNKWNSIRRIRQACVNLKGTCNTGKTEGIGPLTWFSAASNETW